MWTKFLTVAKRNSHLMRGGKSVKKGKSVLKRQNVLEHLYLLPLEASDVSVLRTVLKVPLKNANELNWLQSVKLLQSGVILKTVAAVVAVASEALEKDILIQLRNILP